MIQVFSINIVSIKNVWLGKNRVVCDSTENSSIFIICFCDYYCLYKELLAIKESGFFLI